MAKDREKIEQQNEVTIPSFIVPFSPIPELEQRCGRHQTTCLRRPGIGVRPHGGESLSTSTPYSRRSLPLELPALDEVDGCIIRTPSLPVLDTFDSDYSAGTPSGGENHKSDPTSRIPIVPAFDLDSFVVIEGEDELKKCEIKPESFPQNDETFKSVENEIAEEVNESEASSSPDTISSLLEFKKPQASPPGSRKRLPVATVTQLHKDSLRDESNVPCCCHCQTLSNGRIDFANISLQLDRYLSDNSNISACVDLSVVSHSDSGYQTFNSTASMTESSQNLSCASSKDIAPVLPMPNIPLPPLPIPASSDLKQLTIQEVLEKHSPSYQAFRDSMIGRKIGIESVDIVSEIYAKGAWPCLHLILSMLDVKDLKCVCSVSRTWKRVCLEDTRSRQRLKEDKAKTREKSLFLGKENLQKLKERAARAAESTGLTSLKKPALLCNSFLQNQEKVAPALPISPTKLLTRGEQYVQEASKLKNEEYLDKCPRCIFPAKVHKVQERGRCTKQTCSYDYCIKCRMAFHGAKPCSVIEGNRTRMGGVGTKRSKKNLRRL